LNQDQIWSQVQEELRFQLAKRTYDMWLKNTSVVSADGSTFRIGVPSKLAKDWLEDRFSGLIQETLQAVTGAEVDIDFVISSSGHRPPLMSADNDAPVENGHENGVEVQDVEPILGSDLNARFKFSSFVVGHNSQFAHAAAKAVAEAPGDSYNPLFIYGGVGLGKTHLMHAIGHEVHDRFPRKRVVYLTSEQFTNEVISSIATARMGEFRHKYRTVDVLLIDDVQFLAGKDRTKEEFFHTFNALHEINKQIVISSDRPPKEIPTLEDRLRSRFEWGLIADIQSPDFETRLAILQSKLGGHTGLVPEEVLSFIAHKVQRNIRELEGALTRVQAFAAVHQRPVDEEEAARLLADIIPAGTRKPINVERIQLLVADFYNVTLDDMKGKRRDKHIVFPRQVAMFLVREETPSSLPAIGKAFGGRDHTTALHSIEKIANELKEDERLRYEVQAIRERLYAE
jgi:chromosomal replication initiator protein